MCIDIGCRLGAAILSLALMDPAGILNAGAKGLSSLWIPSRQVRDLEQYCLMYKKVV